MPRPFIPVPNTAQFQMIYTQGGQIMENVFNVTGSAPFTASTLTAVINAIDAWDNTATTGWKNFRNGNCQLIRLHGRALDTASSPVVDFVLPAARGGAINGAQALPNNITWCVTFQTGLAGRSYRGRWYLCGLASSQLQVVPNQNLLASSAASAIIASLGGLKSAVHALGGAPDITVVSYMSNGAWRVTGVATPVTNFSYSDLFLDSQRRRLPGRGA